MSSSGATALSPSTAGPSTGDPASAAASALGIWNKTSHGHLPADVTRQLQNIYGDHFPLEARHSLAGWVEAAFSEDLDTSNPQHEEHARTLVVQLVQQLEAKAQETADFPLKTKLEQIIDSFKVSHNYIHSNIFPVTVCTTS